MSTELEMMRYCLLLLVFTLFLTPITYAQKISFGVKGGVNYSTIRNTSDDFPSNDFRTGFHIGGLAEISITEKFSVQPEFIYSQQGSQSNFQERDFMEKRTFALNYINIPILAKFYLYKGLSLNLGPQFGFNVSGRSKGSESSNSRDIGDDINTFDFGAGGGLAYKLNNGLSFDVRFIKGFLNVPKDSNENENTTNLVYSLSLGYQF